MKRILVIHFSSLDRWSNSMSAFHFPKLCRSAILVSVMTVALVYCSTAHGSIIASLDFVTDFSTSFISTGGVNESTVSASTAIAAKSDGSGTNGLRLTYTGSGIDTSGFENILLNFTYSETSGGTGPNIEHTIVDSGGSSVAGDGFIVGGDISYNSNGTGAPTPPLAFSSSFDNGGALIDALFFLLTINANAETIQISDLTIEGTPINDDQVPEQASLVVWAGILAIAGVGVVIARKRSECNEENAA